MTSPAWTMSPGRPDAESAILDADGGVIGHAAAVTIPCGRGVLLSGLLAEPEKPARGTVLALHGVGMCSRYFDADGGNRSFLRTAVSAGLRVLAVDRPGYGASAPTYPDGIDIRAQAACIANALAGYHVDLTALTILGHSFGSKVALAIAADGALDVDHVEFAGLGHRYAADPTAIALLGQRAVTSMHWGPVRCYPPGTFMTVRRRGIVAETPPNELMAALRWPTTIGHLAARVSCTVHASFAEHERWWHATPHDIAEMSALFGSGTFTSSTIPETGHNSSLGYAAPQYHRAVCDRILAKQSTQGSAA